MIATVHTQFAKSFEMADDMYLSGDDVDAISNILEENENIQEDF